MFVVAEPMDVILSNEATPESDGPKVDLANALDLSESEEEEDMGVETQAESFVPGARAVIMTTD